MKKKKYKRKYQAYNEVNELDEKMIPVEEFAKLRGMPSEKVIQMIRDGEFKGQIKKMGSGISKEKKISRILTLNPSAKTKRAS